MTIKTRIECPYCNKKMGKQGIYGHMNGNHPEKVAEYRAAHPPKRSSIPLPVTVTTEEAKPEEPIPIVEESKPDPEETKIESKPEVKPEPKKEDPKPEKKTEPKPEVTGSGDVKPSKGKSFLDRILDYDISF